MGLILIPIATILDLVGGCNCEAKKGNVRELDSEPPKLESAIMKNEISIMWCGFNH